MVPDQAAVLLLPQRFGADGFSLAGNAQAVLRQRLQLPLVPFLNQGEAVPHILLGDGFPLRAQGQQTANHRQRLFHRHVIPADAHPGVPAENGNSQLLLQNLHIPVKGPEQSGNLLRFFNGNLLLPHDNTFLLFLHFFLIIASFFPFVIRFPLKKSTNFGLM